MTPSAVIVETANRLHSTTDSEGRQISVKRPNALDKLRLLKAAGPILSENQAWLGVAILAVAAVELDGIPIPPPTNEQQVEATVARLGDHGLDAVANTLTAIEAEITTGNSSRTPI